MQRPFIRAVHTDTGVLSATDCGLSGHWLGTIPSSARRASCRRMMMAGTEAQEQAHKRPPSPHLQIYRWPLPMAMSILHRITGGGLYVGTLLMAWWLIATALGPNAYATFGAFINSWIGQLILFGYTWALL